MVSLQTKILIHIYMLILAPKLFYFFLHFTNGYQKNRKSTHESDQNVQQLKNYYYEARLRRLNLPKYRRLRRDMKHVFNIVTGKYTTNPKVDFNLSIVFNTRAKMRVTYMHYNLRKHFFSNIIIAVWNNPPNIIVMQSLLTYLKFLWIDSALIRNLNLIDIMTLPE